MTGAGIATVAVVGPSGAGKDTLMARAAAARPNLRLIRRVITRPADAGGEDFDAVTAAEFAAMKAAGRLALDWQAHGLCYGIPHLAVGRGPSLVNLSRGVLPRAARVFPGLRVIHVTARPDVLARRLADRGRETAADIDRRIARAAPPDAAPLDAGGLPVTHIDNSGDLDHALAAFLSALNEVAVP